MVMNLRSEAPDWRGAKCIPYQQEPGQDVWFGEVNGRPAPELMETAARVCNGRDNGIVCPRRHACLIFALANNEASGVWGGMREDDLKYMRNHVPKEQWRWRPPYPEHVKEKGAELRAQRLRAA